MNSPMLLVVAATLALAGDLPRPEVTVRVEGDYRWIKSNGIPDHEPGQFPRRGNPNSISAQPHEFRIPVKPAQADAPVRAGHAVYGVAVNGVPFEMGTAEFWNFDPSSGWNYDAMSGKLDLGLDEHHAHVQPTGTYHYHGLPTGLIKNLGGDAKIMRLIGYAADGFPIYTDRAHSEANNAQSALKKMRSSYQLKKGTRPSGPGGRYDGTFAEDWEYVSGSGELDDCNGRTGVTPEYPTGTYYYCLTEGFPQLARYWRGQPDESFMKRRGGPPGGPRGPGAGGRKGGPGLLPPGFPLTR